MHDLLSGLFSYPFIQRALIAGTLVALCSALLGVSLVLKRYSMIGDGLSHVGFGAMAVAMALGAAPLAVALPVVILAAFFLLRLSRGSRLAGDSAIALVSSGALAIGVVATSLSSGSNVDVMNYLFGSILTMTAADVKLAVLLSLAVLLLFLLLYHRIFAVTFDETFARATGIRANLYNMVLALLTARYHCHRHAPDGYPAHLQSYHLPGPFGHAHQPQLSRRDGRGGRAFGGLLLGGGTGLFPAFHPHRRQRRPGGSGCLFAAFPLRSAAPPQITQSECCIFAAGIV